MKKKIQKQQNLVLYIIIIILAVGIIALSLILFNILNKQNKVINEVKQPVTENKSIEQNNEITPSENVPKAQEPPFKEYKFRYINQVNVKGPLDELIYKIPIPQNEENRQYIKFTKVSQKPSRVYTTLNNKIAEYVFKNVPSGKIEIVYEGIAKVRTYDLEVARQLNHNDAPNEDLSKYLRPEKFIESDDKTIINAANKITGNTQEEIVQHIYEFIQKNLKYSITPNLGAKEALRRKTGKCSEYSALMTALCRAKNIPARIVVGEMLDSKSVKHAWVEIYFDKYGWVTFDPTIQGVVVRRYKSGKFVESQVTYKSEDTMKDYIILGRNYISFEGINYTGSNYNISANYLSKIEITK